MIKKELVQGTPEWLALRKTRITGTDAGVIMGLNPYKTPYVLWQQKLGMLPPDEENEAMREGTRLEKQAVSLYEKLSGNETFPNVVMKDNWGMASLDGINFDGDIILEVKCGVKSYELANEGTIPDYYMAQIQHNLYISDAKKCDYFCYRPDEKPITIEVERDEDFMVEMLKKEAEFYACLKGKVAPEMTLKDVEVIKDPEHPFRMLEIEWKEVKRQLDYWKAKEESLKAQMLEYADGNSVQGVYAKVTPYERKGTVQYKKIPELKGVDLEQYRGKPSYAFRVTELKEKELDL